ncbi:MAG: efflux RND transporter permease subunit, partial [Myxococcota bacterium]
MNLSVLAHRYRPVVYFATLIAMVGGVVAYFTLPAQEDPSITVREAVVTTRYPGLSAERMELLVTKHLEEAVRRIPEVKEIRSTTSPGLSVIHVVIADKYFELDQIWDELREQVEDASAGLPSGATPPVINDDFGDVAVVTAALTSSDFPMRDASEMAEHVRDQLYAVEG